MRPCKPSSFVLVLCLALGTASARAAPQSEPDGIEHLLQRMEQRPAPPPLRPAPAAVAPAEPDELELMLLNRGLLRAPSGFALPQPMDRSSELVVAAMGFLGRPYTWGGSSWETGFDCSGFVQAIHRQSAGVRLPRSAAEQAAATQPIEREELQPGDLVFYNTSRREFSHVGIYVGDNRFIHAPTAGSPIRMADMRLPYWESRFNGARRAIPSASVATSQPFRGTN